VYHLRDDRHAWGVMEILILVAIFALLIFGPRRNGRPRNRAAIAFGALILLVFALAFGFGSIWNWLLAGFARQ
jgi:hypothetical protein